MAKKKGEDEEYWNDMATEIFGGIGATGTAVFDEAFANDGSYSQALCETIEDGVTIGAGVGSYTADAGSATYDYASDAFDETLWGTHDSINGTETSEPYGWDNNEMVVHDGIIEPNEESK